LRIGLVWRVGWIAALVVLLSAPGVGGAADRSRAQAPAPPRPRLDLYGDSLLAETSAALRTSFRALEPWWDIEVHAFPGTGICSWWDELRATDARAVGLLFSGVVMTDCILGKRKWPEAYLDDARAAARLFDEKGTRVIWLGWPRPAGGIVSPHADDIIWHYYEEVAAGFGHHMIDPGLALFDASSFSYPLTMRCLTPTEPGCVDGHVPVRDLAGGHLCPVTDLTGPCPVYSSGIRRYALAAARELAALLPSPS
jgi:hypothetical protein